MATLLSVTLLAACYAVALGETGVFVTAPQAMKTRFPSGISASMSTFGKFPYGAYLTGLLTVISSNGCSSLPSAPGTVFLIKRGDCLFTDKVQNAQSAGAKAVIVYNDRLSSDLVIMAGRPSAVAIPSVFISNDDGAQLVAAGVAMTMNLTFSLTALQSSSAYFVLSLWEKEDLVLSALLDVVKESRWDFKPYFNVTTCQDCKVSNSCIAEGTYCAFGVTDPVSTLQEVVRHQCMWSADSASYIVYLKSWLSTCAMAPSCEAAYTAAGIAKSSVEACLKGSYSSNFKSDRNSVLDTVTFNFQSLNVHDAPSVFIGGVEYRGDLKTEYFQRAVCTQQSSALSACSSFVCSPGCWTEMQSNDACDALCNTRACSYDGGRCTPTPTNTTTPDNTTTPVNTTSLCASGCTLSMLQTDLCYSQCDNPACNYSNWHCRCAEDCTDSMVGNGACDSECNSLTCYYDGGDCIDPPIDTDEVDEESSGSSGLGLRIWIAIAFSIVGFLSIVVVMVLLVCWLRKRRVSRNRQPRVPVPVVPPARPSSEQVIAMLGPRKFVPEMVEFGATSCVVCLSDFVIGEDVVKTMCRHLFHYACLRGWLGNHQECPICKQDPLFLGDDTNAHNSDSN